MPVVGNLDPFNKWPIQNFVLTVMISRARLRSTSLSSAYRAKG